MQRRVLLIETNICFTEVSKYARDLVFDIFKYYSGIQRKALLANAYTITTNCHHLIVVGFFHVNAVVLRPNLFAISLPIVLVYSVYNIEPIKAVVYDFWFVFAGGGGCIYR